MKFQQHKRLVLKLLFIFISLLSACSGSENSDSQPSIPPTSIPETPIPTTVSTPTAVEPTDTSPTTSVSDALYGKWATDGESIFSDTSFEFYKDGSVVIITTDGKGTEFEDIDYFPSEFSFIEDNIIQFDFEPDDEITTEISFPSSETLIMDISFGEESTESIVLRKIGEVGVPLESDLQQELMGKWGFYGSPNHPPFTYSFFEDGISIWQIGETFEIAVEYSFINDNNLWLMDESRIGSVSFPSSERLIIDFDTQNFMVLERFETLAVEDVVSPENTIIGTWEGKLEANDPDEQPKGIEILEFYEDGTLIITTQVFSDSANETVKVGEYWFEGGNLIFDESLLSADDAFILSQDLLVIMPSNYFFGNVYHRQK